MIYFKTRYSREGLVQDLAEFVMGAGFSKNNDSLPRWGVTRTCPDRALRASGAAPL